MRVPNWENAVVDIAKLRDYCLSPDNVTGKHKARVFFRVLGLTQADAFLLKQWILDALPKEDATAGRIDEWGTRYTVDFNITHQSRTARVRSTWIVLTGDDVPKLTSCYVL